MVAPDVSSVLRTYTVKSLTIGFGRGVEIFESNPSCILTVDALIVGLVTIIIHLVLVCILL